MASPYSAVQWEYRELLEEAIDKKASGKIFYFDEGKAIAEATGTIVALQETINQGMFIQLDPLAEIRIDRIITLFGKPGAAYDEYNAYADSCMDCMGGYEKDELEGS